MHVWRPEVDTECHLLFTVFFKTGFLTEPGLTLLSGMAGSSSKDSVVSASP